MINTLLESHKIDLPQCISRERACRGQGLIEMLLVVLFTSLTVIEIIKFQNYLAYSTNATQQQNDANILAVKQLEMLRDFDVLAVQGSYSSYAGIASGSSNATVGNTTYAIVWTVTTTAAPSYKNLNVTVSWTDRFNASQSVGLITNVAGIDPSSPATFM